MRLFIKMETSADNSTVCTNIMDMEHVEQTKNLETGWATVSGCMTLSPSRPHVHDCFNEWAYQSFSPGGPKGPMMLNVCVALGCQPYKAVREGWVILKGSSEFLLFNLQTVWHHKCHMTICTYILICQLLYMVLPYLKLYLHLYISAK